MTCPVLTHDVFLYSLTKYFNFPSASFITWRVTKKRILSFICVPSQERRREFEANLEKIGLQLETDDKSVRNSTKGY